MQTIHTERRKKNKSLRTETKKDVNKGDTRKQKTEHIFAGHLFK